VAVGTISIEVNKQPATDTAGFNLLLWSSLQGLVNNESDFYIKATEGGGPPKVEKRLALSPTGTLEPSYDLDGNLLQDALWDYEWNAENRLVKQTHRNDLTLDQLEQVQLEFIYDSQGRRVKKTVSTWNGSSFVPASETLFLYDGWNLLAEIDSSSQTVIRSYTWGHDLSGHAGLPRPGVRAGGVGGLLSLEKGADVFLPSYDHNGNITAYSDASGSVVAEFEYDPFGLLLRETGENAQDVMHRFSTKYLDEESGYYYYGFRYYDAETGRWLNRDPIEEQGGYNLYGFVLNNRFSYIDNLGKAYMGHLRLIESGGHPNLSGPDVTNALNKTIHDFRSAFRGNYTYICEICNLMMGDAWTLVDNWDIPAFANMGREGWPAEFGTFENQGTGLGKFTVVYNGEVYHAHAVNYILFGKIFRLCYEDVWDVLPGENLEDTWTAARQLIYLHKAVFSPIARQFNPRTRGQWGSAHESATNWARVGFWNEEPPRGLDDIKVSGKKVPVDKFRWEFYDL